ACAYCAAADCRLAAVLRVSGSRATAECGHHSANSSARKIGETRANPLWNFFPPAKQFGALVISSEMAPLFSCARSWGAGPCTEKSLSDWKPKDLEMCAGRIKLRLEPRLVVVRENNPSGLINFFADRTGIDPHAFHAS